MVRVNQTLPHCVNQMGKKQSKPLAERHGSGTAWERHGMCESAFIAFFSIIVVFGYTKKPKDSKMQSLH
jgi:hypothetical protein